MCWPNSFQNLGKSGVRRRNLVKGLSEGGGTGKGRKRRKRRVLYLDKIFFRWKMEHLTSKMSNNDAKDSLKISIFVKKSSKYGIFEKNFEF